MSDLQKILLGAILSLLGGVLGAQINACFQRKKDMRVKKANQTLSASILYVDIIGNLTDMINFQKYMVNKKENYRNILSFGSHNKRYSEHIATLENTLTVNELNCIHHFYGLIMAFQTIRNEDVKSANSTEAPLRLESLTSQYCNIIFERSDALSTLVTTAKSDIDTCISLMKDEYRLTLIKLIELKAP